MPPWHIDTSAPATGGSAPPVRAADRPCPEPGHHSFCGSRRVADGKGHDARAAFSSALCRQAACPAPPAHPRRAPAHLGRRPHRWLWFQDLPAQCPPRAAATQAPRARRQGAPRRRRACRPPPRPPGQAGDPRAGPLRGLPCCGRRAAAPASPPLRGAPMQRHASGGFSSAAARRHARLSSPISAAAAAAAAAAPPASDPDSAYRPDSRNAYLAPPARPGLGTERLYVASTSLRYRLTMKPREGSGWYRRSSS